MSERTTDEFVGDLLKLVPTDVLERGDDAVLRWVRQLGNTTARAIALEQAAKYPYRQTPAETVTRADLYLRFLRSGP